MKRFDILMTSVAILVVVESTIAQERIRVVPKDRTLRTAAANGALQAFGLLGTESFDTFLPDGWKKITNFEGIGWQQGAVDSMVPGFDQGVIDAPPSGGSFVAYASWATGDEDGDYQTGQATDQWLISPQIPGVEVGDSLRFYLRYFNQFNDNLDVLISNTTDTSTADFDTLVTTLTFLGTGNNEWQSYSFSITDFAAPGDSIYIAFRERVANTRTAGDALFLDLVEVSSLVTEVSRRNVAIRDFRLHQNYPNPFNPATLITFSLTRQMSVTLRVYNLHGQMVANLLEEHTLGPGQHQVRFDGSRLANGLYYYRLEAGNFSDVRKMTLLK